MPQISERVMCLMSYESITLPFIFNRDAGIFSTACDFGCGLGDTDFLPQAPVFASSSMSTQAIFRYRVPYEIVRPH